MSRKGLHRYHLPLFRVFLYQITPPFVLLSLFNWNDSKFIIFINGAFNSIHCADFLVSAAVAEFKGPSIFGVVRLAQVNMELTRIEANFSGLPPGKYGWSINEFGDLTRGAASTGKVLNPSKEEKEVGILLPGPLLFAFLCSLTNPRVCSFSHLVTWEHWMLMKKATRSILGPRRS